MKLKWVIIDSLMFRQLKHAPFLQSIAKNYKADFIPLLGYQEDGLSFFSGKKPDQINVGPLFCYSPETSIFRWLKPFRSFRFLDVLFFKYTLITLSHFFKKEKHLSKSNIPINLIHNFDISTHSLKPNTYALEIETVFDKFIRSNKSFAFIKGPWLITNEGNGFVRNFFRNMFCRGDQTTIKLAQKHKDKDLSVVWLLELDALAHRFGPDSQEVISQIKKIDKLVENYLKGEKFIIHSDHGIAQVRGVIDISSILKKIPFKVPDDYLFFLDSAIARFWLFAPDVFPTIKKELEFLGMGHFLTDQEKIEFGYNFSDNRYGHEFFVLDEGKIILPSYMSNKMAKGMHGYLPEGDQIGIFLSNLDLPKKNEILYDEILKLVYGKIYSL